MPNPSKRPDDGASTRSDPLRGAGGTPGGVPLFVVGVVCAIGGLWLLLDSVRVSADGLGMMSHWMGGMFGGGAWMTTSMAILFVPFFAGVAVLFYDAKIRLGWALMWSGLAILAVEVLSRLQFWLQTKLSHLVLILALIAAGVGLIIRSLRDSSGQASALQPPEPKDPGPK